MAPIARITMGMDFWTAAAVTTGTAGLIVPPAPPPEHEESMSVQIISKKTIHDEPKFMRLFAVFSATCIFNLAQSSVLGG